MEQTLLKPIRFASQMVDAIRHGKTVTRRLASFKEQPILDESGEWHWKDCRWKDDGQGLPQSDVEKYAPWKPGDVLWVQEDWVEDVFPGYLYRADVVDVPDFGWKEAESMPRRAARFFLRVTGVRAERLRDSYLDDLEAEGMNIAVGFLYAALNFANLWDGFLKLEEMEKYGFDVDPWVWVLTFEQCERPEGWPFEEEIK